MWDIIIIAVLLIILLIIAVILLFGRGGFLIAGFNMLPKEKKDKVDVIRLCKFMGKVMLGVCCSVALLLVNLITGIEVLNTIALIILALSVVVTLVWANLHYMAPLRK